MKYQKALGDPATKSGANILAREILTTYDKPLNKNSAIAILQNLTKLSRA